MAWEALAAAGISAAASVLGVPWQQKLQKDLMHENEAINLAQWQRESEYNSPKEQMKRLREAGLNPDLVYGGNVANTAGQAELTSGTPQAPGAASAVSQAVRNMQDAAMVQSEISKNESEANRNNAQAGETVINTQFKESTFSANVGEAFAKLDFTKQQLAESQKRCEMLDVQMHNLLVNCDFLHARIRTLDQYELNLREDTRGKRYYADQMQVLSEFSRERTQKQIDLLSSEIGLNNARKRELDLSNKLFYDSFQFQLSKIKSDATSNQAYAEYMIAQRNYQRRMVQYMPFIYADAFMNGEKLFKHDEDGNILFDKDGRPVPLAGYADYMRGMDMMHRVNQEFNLFTESAGNVISSIGEVRTGFSFKNLKSPKGQPPSSPIPKPKWTSEKEYWQYVRSH